MFSFDKFNYVKNNNNLPININFLYLDNQFDSDLHLETIKDLLQFTALQSLKNLN
tara:strand:- start:375 stop:539 length:165 start_codon:yes stop_codon:yes gene_type:complete